MSISIFRVVVFNAQESLVQITSASVTTYDSMHDQQELFSDLPNSVVLVERSSLRGSIGYGVVTLGHFGAA